MPDSISLSIGLKIQLQQFLLKLRIVFLHGKGLSNDFIQYFYFYIFILPLQYPEAGQPEVHYPYLYSLFILPFYNIMWGKTAFVAKLPTSW